MTKCEPIYVTILASTDSAVLCSDSVTEDWIPRCLIEDGDALEKDDEQEINVATWFLEKEGWL